MKFRDQIEIAAPAAAVWAVVVDPTSLASCIPGVEGVRKVDDRTFEGAVTASVGPIEGQFTFTAVLTDQVPAERLTVRVEGTDSVTKSRLEADVLVTLAAGGARSTRLDYDANLKVHGRIAILGEMVLRATAGVMIGQVTRCLRTNLEAESPG